jgi:hypothetical protein
MIGICGLGASRELILGSVATKRGALLPADNI